MKQLSSIAKLQIILYSMVERGVVSSSDFATIHKYLEMAKDELFETEGNKDG